MFIGLYSKYADMCIYKIWYLLSKAVLYHSQKFFLLIYAFIIQIPSQIIADKHPGNSASKRSTVECSSWILSLEQNCTRAEKRVPRFTPASEYLDLKHSTSIVVKYFYELKSSSFLFEIELVY